MHENTCKLLKCFQVSNRVLLVMKIMLTVFGMITDNTRSFLIKQLNIDINLNHLYRLYNLVM